MADVSNTTATMDGLFKEVYGDVERVIPEVAKLARVIPFVAEDEKEGKSFNFPVVLTREQGFTLDSDYGSAFTLNDAEAAVSRNASINGIAYVGKALVSYGAMSTALKSEGEARTRAFVKATKHVVENMAQTAAFVREVELMHGGGADAEAANVGGIGVVSSIASSTVTITDASWSAGIWSGMENGFVDIYDTTLATQRNSTDLQVTDVDIAAKEFTFTGTQSGTVATDVVYFRGAQGNEMAGLKRSITNAGSLHGISAATYSLWQGTTETVTSQLTFQKVLKALNVPVAKGLASTTCAVVSPPTWTDLNNDLAALRRYSDKAGGYIEQGAEAITYYGQSGVVEIVPHLYQKDGEAHLFPKDHVCRVGSADLTFMLPGGTDKFLVPVRTSSAYEMQCWWHQGFLLKHPGKAAVVTGIVNST